MGGKRRAGGLTRLCGRGASPAIHITIMLTDGTDFPRLGRGRGRSARQSTMGQTMQRKVMISCAVTGSADTPGKNPAVPVTPQQIAASAVDAAKAGAAIVHIHVRDPQTTRPSMDPALYREVV